MHDDLLNNHEVFMRSALFEAEKACKKEEVPVGCVIVHNNKIISKAHNQREMLTDPTAHAEMIAITQAASYLDNWRLNETVIYVTLEPCLMCMGAIIEARIDTLVFGTRDNKDNGLLSAFDLKEKFGMAKKLNIVQNILEFECKSILQNFFFNRR